MQTCKKVLFHKQGFFLKNVVYADWKSPFSGRIVWPFTVVTCDQVDQIGRIFAFWAIVNCGSENCRNSVNFRLIFTTVKVTYLLTLATKWFGQYSGRYFHKLSWSPCL
jgi:hypothetical protein